VVATPLTFAIVIAERIALLDHRRLA